MRLRALGFVLLAAAGSTAAAAARPAAAPHRAAAAGLPFYDSRDAAPRAVAASARTSAARTRLRRRLGRQGIVAVDPATGTARMVARLDGALSGPAQDGPGAVARRYAEQHAAALGVTAGALDDLRLEERQTTASGLTVLRWSQRYRGIPAFDNGLEAAVDRAGRMITVGGSPAPDVAVADVTPGLTAAQARDAVGRNVGAPRSARVVEAPQGPRREAAFSDGSTAALTIFVSADGPRLAWEVGYPGAEDALYHAVVDATTGGVLYRADATKFASASSIYPYFPGAPAGGTAGSVVFPGSWFPTGTPPTKLAGTNAHAYSDLNDDNTAQSAEEVAPSAGSAFDYPLQPFTANCPVAGIVCSWNPSTSGSYATNRKQNATQVFWLVNTFHDHLRDAPIDFSAAKGEPVFEGADAVNAEADDGAALTKPRQVSAHRNNANMSTPPDGQAPRMQMYLFGNSSSFNNINGGDDAAIVYHEYTHGLSNRLITDSTGWGALNSAQAGAMGEAWSDWYAMDFLVDQGYVADTSAEGEVDLGAYTDKTADQLRSQPMDCRVGGTCPGTSGAGSGGYTYGDFGKVYGSPEVHGDGEIWGETLWDLRDALGSAVTEQIVTDAMRVSPPEPSFLDMRNAILAADTADFGGSHHGAIWNVFRLRGMGYFASTTGGADTAPIQDFSAPPGVDTPTGTISGTVVRAATGTPVAGAPVTIGGGQFTTTTASDGSYRLSGVPVGTYPQVVVTAPAGYDDAVSRNVTVAENQTTVADMSIERDWTASAAGAAVSDTGGRTLSPLDCGPDAVLDQALSTGWSASNPSYSDPTLGRADTPTATIKLPERVRLSGFAIDPSAVCGDDGSAALGHATLETSPDGTTWTPLWDGTFTASDDGRLNRFTVAARDDVRYVRIALLAPQDATPNGSGEQFIDLTELSVYGTAVNRPPSGSLAAPATAFAGDAVTLDASSFVAPDSTITGYAWDFDGDGTTDATTMDPTVDHVYATGTQHPSVTVSDDRGASGTAASEVVVSDPPIEPAAPAGGGDGTSSSATVATTPAAPRVTLIGTALRGQVRIRLACPTRCRTTVRATVSPALARRLGLPSRGILLERRSLGSGVWLWRIPVAARALRGMSRARLHRITATLTVTTSSPSGNRRFRHRVVVRG